MTTNIVMPNLGFDTQFGVIIEWYKKLGDTIKKGEAIALVEADKANVELESIASGVLLEILANVNEDIAVGEVIARVGIAEKLPTNENTPRISPLAERVAKDKGLDVTTIDSKDNRGWIMRRDIDTHIQKASDGIRALPKVRRAARLANITLSDLLITDRPITLADLEQVETATSQATIHAMQATEPQATNTPEAGITRVPLGKTRQRIAKRLVKSKQEAPHFYVTGEFDLSNAINSLSNYKAGLNDLLQYLTVQALLQVPEINGRFEDNTLYIHETINLSLAVARDSGLVTPVIPNAEAYSLNGLAQYARDLIKRTHADKLTQRDTSIGTFTISNLGVIKSVDHFTAIINPPQIAILAVGAIKPRPVIINGGFHARKTVHLTLSGDHRFIDGMHLGRFMKAFQNALDKFV